MNVLARLVGHSGLIVFLGACLAGCWVTVHKDVDGNMPEDIVHRFVKSSRQGSIVEAETYWRAGDVNNIEMNRRMKFAEFCAYFSTETYVLQYEGVDKGVHLVRFLGKDGGKTRAQLLFLDPPDRSSDRRWKLREDRRYDPER